MRAARARGADQGEDASSNRFYPRAGFAVYGTLRKPSVHPSKLQGPPKFKHTHTHNPTAAFCRHSGRSDPGCRSFNRDEPRGRSTPPQNPAPRCPKIGRNRECGNCRALKQPAVPVGSGGGQSAGQGWGGEAGIPRGGDRKGPLWREGLGVVVQTPHAEKARSFV